MAVNAAANRALAPEASKLLDKFIATQNAEHEGVAGAAPHRGRRKDTQGRLCGRGGSGAGRSEAGQRHAAEELGAAAGHPAEPRSDLRQLPGLRNRVRLDLETSRATCTWAPHGPRAPSCWRRPSRTGSTAVQGLQHEVAHLKEHAPLPAHQPPSARPLRHANSAGRGTAGSQKRQRSKSILHLTCLPLALTSPERASGRRSCCQ